MALSPSQTRPYEPPEWAKRSFTNVPTHGRLCLGNFPTPLYRLGGSALFPTLADRGLEFFVKRDDSSGGVELGGNKVRKLEFLLAEAVSAGGGDKGSSSYDSVITIGGEQSNHCRATAAACRMCGLEPHLILRSRKADYQQDLGLVGNLLVDRILQSKIYTCTPGEYGRVGSVQLVARLAKELKRQGKRPYCIPVGGSNGLGTWGYLEAVKELLAQWESSTDAASSDKSSSIDHIVFACGSGGTAAGIALGIALAFAEKEARPIVHAIGVCDDPDYFYNYTAGIADEMGLVLPKGYTSTEDFMRAHCVVHQGKGLGYAASTPEELNFVQAFASATGIVLDPVYSGKALYNFVNLMIKDSDTFQNANVLFWHTGGALGLYDKAPDMEDSLTSKSPCLRLDVYGKGIGVDISEPGD